MKSLLLMRHAKSSWADPGMQDHDRPLNNRGIRDAPRMGELLKSLDLIPDQIICSTALRARQTAAAVAEVVVREVVTFEQLYLASVRTWIDTLAEQAQSGIVLAIGHNPGIEEFIEQVADNSMRMPTAAIAWFNCESQNGRFSFNDLKLQTVWRPKEIDEDQA